jgi:hypothetical protein
MLPALTALAVIYANWRIASVGRAGLLWFGQRRGGWAVPAAGRRAHDEPSRQPLISP